MSKRLYTVREGDTLSIISRDELGDISRWREVAYINSLSAPYTIFPGQNLLLPVDDYPLQVVVTEFAPEPNGTAATKTAAFELTPATLAIGLAVVAVFLLMDKK